jgi:hypothetical protein
MIFRRILALLLMASFAMSLPATSSAARENCAISITAVGSGEPQPCCPPSGMADECVTACSPFCAALGAEDAETVQPIAMARTPGCMGHYRLVGRLIGPELPPPRAG